jgi:hypothetical protein
MVILHLAPILVSHYFPTADGPAHLYNSRLILELLTNNQSPIGEFFAFNSFLNPNSIGHLILSGLMLVFPAFIAEKLLLSIYLIGLPISFRYLFMKLQFKNTYLIYFIFPFTYSFLFYFGFYNFLIGLVFFFFTLAYWIESIKNNLHLKQGMVLFILTLCIFLSHLFVLLMFSLCLVSFNIPHIKALFNSNQRNTAISQLGIQLLIIAPTLILSILFLGYNPVQTGELNYLSLSELWEMIQQVQPVKGVKYGKEAIFSKWIFILLAATSLYLLVFRLKKIKSTVNQKSLLWGLVSIVCLIALFKSPDSSQSMGFISSRIILFFFLFYIIFLSTQKIPSWLGIISFLLINYVNIALLKIYYQNAQENKGIVESLSEAVQKVEVYSIILPINTSENWQFAHFSNYLGVEKPVVVTENYEATLNYFPLKWKKKTMAQIPYQESGEKVINAIIANQLVEHIDYIFILQKKSTSESSPLYLKNIMHRINLIYKNEENNILLYKLDPSN